MASLARRAANPAPGTPHPAPGQRTAELSRGPVCAYHGRGKLLGFDPDRGELLWNCAGDPGYICASVVAHDGVIYAVPRDTVMAVRAGGRGGVTQSRRLWTGRKGSNVP